MMLLRGRSDDSIGFRQGGGWCRASVIHNFSLNLEIPPRFFFYYYSSFLPSFFFTCLHIIVVTPLSPDYFIQPPSTSESFSIQLERQPHAFAIEKSNFFFSLLLFSFHFSGKQEKPIFDGKKKL